MSQASWQSTASTGELTNTDYLGTVSSLNPIHPWANRTSTNGAGAPNGPNLVGTPSRASGPRGYSGAASSAPVQGSYWAPGTLLLGKPNEVSLGTCTPLGVKPLFMRYLQAYRYISNTTLRLPYPGNFVSVSVAWFTNQICLASSRLVLSISYGLSIFVTC